MQPYFGQDNLQIHYLDTDSFIFAINSKKGLIEDLEHFKKYLDPSHDLCSQNKK